MDLSWPTGFAINSGIPKDIYMGCPYKLALPTTDDLCTTLRLHGPYSFMYSRDISRAYRHLHSDPLTWRLLGFLWDGKYYFDASIPFGIRWGAMAMQRTTTAVTYIMDKHGFQTYTYIDDIAGIGTTLDATESGFKKLKQLFKDLGLEESESKAQPPSHQITWLGVEFDAVAMEIRMPNEKISDSIIMLNTWRHKSRATRTELRKLLGRLFHLGKTCHSIRLFVNRMLDTLRACPDTGTISLSTDFKKDVNWFLMFLPQYNGIHLLNPFRPDITVEVDSCLTGCRGLCVREIYSSLFFYFQQILT